MKELIKHLRIPFSVFLMPVFFMSLSTIENATLYNTIILWIALHVFLYPASNAYNSYQDKDTESIGLIKNPKPVTKSLFWVSVIMDIIGISLIYFNTKNSISVFIALGYICFSRLYSWRKVRLKQYPFLGFLTVFIFQGAAIYLLITYYFGAEITLQTLLLAVSSCFIFGGAYPITQIYQHSSDLKDKVKTLSMVLGVNGTFIFAQIMFAIGLGMLIIFSNTQTIGLSFYSIFIWFIVVGLFLTPWQLRCKKDKLNANYDQTMQFLIISSICANLAMIQLFILSVL